MSTDPALPALAGCLARVVGPEPVPADPAVVGALDPGARIGRALLRFDVARRPG